MELTYDFNYKIVIAGDADVGKTTFFKTIQKPYPISFDKYNSTVGIDFTVLYKMIENKKIKINLWDTAGQERYRSLIKTYLRDAVGYILMFDLNNESSFNSIEKWFDNINSINNCDHDHPILLIGNKLDLNSNVDKKRIEKILQYKENIIYSQISLKNKDNINIIFDLFIEQIHHNIFLKNKKCVGLRSLSSYEEDIKLKIKNNKKCCS